MKWQHVLDKLDRELWFLKKASPRDDLVATCDANDPGAIDAAVASLVNGARERGYTRKSNHSVIEKDGQLQITVTVGNHP